MLIYLALPLDFLFLLGDAGPIASEFSTNYFNKLPATKCQIPPLIQFLELLDLRKESYQGSSRFNVI